MGDILLDYWWIIGLVIFASGIIKGTTGFGFALFALPVLVHYVPIKVLVPLLTMFNFSSSLQIVLQTKQLKLNRRIVMLSAFGVVGIIIGSLILKFMAERWLKLFVAIILMIVSILFLAGYRFKVRKYKRGNTIAGFISGLLGGCTSLSGPPLALFLTSIKMESLHFRFTFAWYSIITSLVAIADYVKIGVVSVQTLEIFFIGLPILILSVRIGKFISGKVSQRLFYKGTIILTFIAGLFMMYNCVSECFWK